MPGLNFVTGSRPEAIPLEHKDAEQTEVKHKSVIHEVWGGDREGQKVTLLSRVIKQL